MYEHFEITGAEIEELAYEITRTMARHNADGGILNTTRTEGRIEGIFEALRVFKIQAPKPALRKGKYESFQIWDEEWDIG